MERRGFTTEDVFGDELIVGSAKHAEVFGVAIAAERTGFLVIELEERVRLATPPVGCHVGALKPVALEDLAASGARNAGTRGVHRALESVWRAALRPRAWRFGINA